MERKNKNFICSERCSRIGINLLPSNRKLSTRGVTTYVRQKILHRRDRRLSYADLLCCCAVWWVNRASFLKYKMHCDCFSSLHSVTFHHPSSVEYMMCIRRQQPKDDAYPICIFRVRISLSKKKNSIEPCMQRYCTANQSVIVYVSVEVAGKGREMCKYYIRFFRWKVF